MLAVSLIVPVAFVFPGKFRNTKMQRHEERLGRLDSAFAAVTGKLSAVEFRGPCVAVILWRALVIDQHNLFFHVLSQLQNCGPWQ